jgi:hypothetical protein
LCTSLSVDNGAVGNTAGDRQIFGREVSLLYDDVRAFLFGIATGLFNGITEARISVHHYDIRVGCRGF